MVSQVEVLEERLKSFLGQLQAECGILDRIVYKNKNQHRRCSYFQYLLKVQRDLKLLHSIHLGELLDSCFHVITGRKAKTKAHLLESLKKRKCDDGKSNFLERLRGAARLLSAMVEPILKTAIEVSILLARTFFMGFSLMVLAILARVRVLVQQMLLDVVSVFNEISSHAQKKQSIKISQDGIEVFREYYPMMDEVVTLECIWKTDKFELVERTDKLERRHDSETLEFGQSTKTSTKYQSIHVFLEDDEPDPMKTDAYKGGLDGVSGAKRKRPDLPINTSNETNRTVKVHIPSVPEDSDGNVMLQAHNITSEGTSLTNSSTPLTSCLSKPSYTVNKKVAFISVVKPAPTPSNATVSQVSESENPRYCGEEHPLFNLFSENDSKGSIF